MDEQVPKAVVQERYERLAALQDQISWDENQALVGRPAEVLVTATDSHKETGRMSGRAEDNRLVHFEVPAGSVIPRPGDVASVVITHAAPFHLIADSLDGAPLAVRRTRAGDAWDRAEAESCAVPATSVGAGAVAGEPAKVSLGLPTLRMP
jgi:tRNA-2-methylthio-N6-dimethylallyladenosine synthase